MLFRGGCYWNAGRLTPRPLSAAPFHTFIPSSA
jgi:hypothetical protein